MGAGLKALVGKRVKIGKQRKFYQVTAVSLYFSEYYSSFEVWIEQGKKRLLVDIRADILLEIEGQENGK